MYACYRLIASVVVQFYPWFKFYFLFNLNQRYLKQTYLIQSGAQEGTQQSFIREVGSSARRSNLLLKNIPFSTEKILLSYNFASLLTAVNSVNFRYN